jgi:hypothetical protein
MCAPRGISETKHNKESMYLALTDGVSSQVLQQSIQGGCGHIQIGHLVVCGKSSNDDSTEHVSGAWHSDIANLICDIEHAEGGSPDAADIWNALTRHLRARDIENNERNLSMAGYWAARAYLMGWRACANGEPLTRHAMVRQIERMGGIVPDLSRRTRRFCIERFRQKSLKRLTDAQLRAALWVTVADWQAAWDA